MSTPVQTFPGSCRVLLCVTPSPTHVCTHNSPSLSCSSLPYRLFVSFSLTHYLSVSPLSFEVRNPNPSPFVLGIRVEIGSWIGVGSGRGFGFGFRRESGSGVGSEIEFPLHSLIFLLVWFVYPRPIVDEEWYTRDPTGLCRIPPVSPRSYPSQYQGSGSCESRP